MKSAAHVKTIETFGNGTSKVTLEVHCESVPGGVVSHTSKQLTADGKVTQRSTLDLLDYQAITKTSDTKEQVPARRRLFQGRLRR